MTKSRPDDDARRTIPLANVVVAAALGLAAVGYFAGIGGADPPPADPLAARSAPVVADDVAAAVTYTELSRVNLGPNRDYHRGLDALPATVDVPAPTVVDDPARLPEALADRARLRAYNGAPPLVPHTIDQRSAAACLACHGKGLRIGDAVARRPSHATMTSCTQCHVEAGEAPLLVATSFTGLPAPTGGARAWTGAPPVVPHRVHMRDDCLSCHGPAGRPGMRTTHPERRSCLQCHAPSAVLDQVPTPHGGPAPFPPRSGS